MKIYSTSQEAIRDITASGEINLAQKKVYRALHQLGPSTGSEIDDHFKSRSTHKRLSELKRMGYVSCVGSRPCKITGKRAQIWKANLEVPEKHAGYAYQEPESRIQMKKKIGLLENQIEALTIEVERLRDVEKKLKLENIELKKNTSQSKPFNMSLF